MNLVLVLPGLLAARAPDADIVAPALARLVAASAAPVRVADGIGAVLAPRYGIVRQTDWPLAPVRAAAAGVVLGNAYWLTADPVTLAVGQFDVGFAGAVTDLSRDETDALLSTLNAHFAADGLAFVAPRPDAWYVSVPQSPDLATHSRAETARAPLRDLTPSGRDAGTWIRWQHEIQMLLHEHAVNIARVERGLAPVNSVWFADGGVAPPRSEPTAAPPTTIAAADDVAAALAAYAGTPARPVPVGLDALPVDAWNGAMNGTLLVAVPQTSADIAAIENSWAAPAWRALVQGRIAAVEIVGDGAGEAVVWTARRPRLFRRLAIAMGPPAFTALIATGSARR